MKHKMRCPVCKTTQCGIVELENNLNAAVCEHCGGEWISQENYERWLEQYKVSNGTVPCAEASCNVVDVQGAKLCPDCGRILLKYKVGHGLNFYVEHCSVCGGIWLDANEWEALQSVNLHGKIHDIISAAWQTQVRDEEMLANLERTYVKRFGAETYEKVKEVRQWLQKQPQRDAILAFLADPDPFEV